jgi:hypothetical protein
MSVFEDVQEWEIDDALAERLLTDGIDGMATVVQMQATGRNVNMQPELQFELVLKVGDRQRTVNHIQVVSAALITQLRSGTQIPVKVDPDDHSQLLIGLAP